MNKIIEVQDLRKTFHLDEIKVEALKGIGLEVTEGEFVAVMGTSGSGKSTFMNIAGCLDREFKGKYWLDGIDVTQLSEHQLADIRNKKIGFVFQSYNLLARTTAYENVELPLLYGNIKLSTKQHRETVMEKLADVGLADRYDRYPNQLSGGQQQRVAIARALVSNPAIILADEPTGNLDTRTSYEIMELLQQLNEQGKTILIVTHEQDIAAFTSRKVVFRDGRIVQQQRVDQPKNASRMLQEQLLQEAS
ncbi:ABC transporter ATP-binding protein [Cesiribacter sp. SM1]|uniref:ABC transporter ATP-binding protein n=1 Tax=Cesiribacter sp. SM1 TaxID=2861196 RepID=UPI002103CCEC|nr:ABC transporter ATP-binding protein [Cesiribacter sp. SM1]